MTHICPVTCYTISGTPVGPPTRPILIGYQKASDRADRLMDNDKTDSIRLVSDPTRRMVRYRSVQPQNETESMSNRNISVEPRSVLVDDYVAWGLIFSVRTWLLNTRPIINPTKLQFLNSSRFRADRNPLLLQHHHSDHYSLESYHIMISFNYYSL